MHNSVYMNSTKRSKSFDIYFDLKGYWFQVTETLNYGIGMGYPKRIRSVNIITAYFSKGLFHLFKYTDSQVL